MEQSFLAFVKSELGRLKQADWLQISEKTGVPIGTIRKIHYGEVADPRIGTIQPLYDHFIAARKAEPKRKRAAA